MAEGKDYPRANRGILTQRSADTVVLLDSRGGEYFSLDEVGARIWDLCDGTRSLAEITRLICSEYDADEATVAADLAELLEELAAAQLLTFHE